MEELPFAFVLPEFNTPVRVPDDFVFVYARDLVFVYVTDLVFVYVIDLVFVYVTDQTTHWLVFLLTTARPEPYQNSVT